MSDASCVTGGVTGGVAEVGNARVDRTIHALVAIYEAAFPGRLRGCYIGGSFGDGDGLATSDLDLTLVFRDRFVDDAEKTRAEALCDACAALSAVELDAHVRDEADLRQGVWPQFKYGARLVYGEECRESAPLVPIEQWTRDRMHTSYWRIVGLFDRPQVVRPPLDFPEPASEFLGYTRRTVRLPDGTEAPCTRDLIRHTGWAATALVAWKTGQYVTRKRDCHRMYRELIGDEHAPLLEDVYVYCRQQWQYLIPDAPEERRRLRSICERALAFENAFLASYKDYLLAELRGADDVARREALAVLARVPYVDGEVETAVRELAEEGEGGTRAVAREALVRLAEACGAGEPSVGYQRQ